MTEFKPPKSDIFGAALTFQLGTGNDGINPGVDAFHFLAAGGSVVLPMDVSLSSFRRLLDGSLVFARPVNGLPTDIALKPIVGGKYALALAITNATFVGFSNPITIELGFGSDIGRVTTNAVILFGSFSPEPLVVDKPTKVYSGRGADTVMQSCGL